MFESKKSDAANSGPAGMNAPREGVDHLAAGAHSGINAAAEAVHPAIDRMASGAHHAVNNADQAANKAADAMAKAGNKAGAKGEEIYATGTGFMREHPAITIGMAVTAGYVLSRLLATR